MPEISNCVRRLRFEHDEMTQEELARRVSVTRQTIIAVERGKYTPSLALAFRIARVFSKGVEEVFVYEVPAPRTDANSSSDGHSSL